MIKKLISFIFQIVFVVVGAYLILSPYAAEKKQDEIMDDYIIEFNQKYYGSETVEAGQEFSENDDEFGTQFVENYQKKYQDPIYQSVLEYNQSIFENKQSELTDVSSYTQAPITIQGLDDDAFGYIKIPVLGKTFPLYIGASDENLAKGAAILGQTSLPIGGMNSNSVIAAHRGWKTGPFFKYIERLSVGDYVFITNPWEPLAYKVTSMEIISPNDIEKLEIQAGKDMITLITCHPYGSHGEKDRLVVYCERDPYYNFATDFDGYYSVNNELSTVHTVDAETVRENQAKLEDDTLSSQAIQDEDVARSIGACFVLLAIAFMALRFVLKLGKIIFGH